jgi:hypothetical protein
MLGTFALTVFAWIFFRAENIGHAFSYISEIFSSSLFDFPNLTGKSLALTTIILVAIFIMVEWIGRDAEYAVENIGKKWKKPIRYAFYYLIIYSIMYFGNFDKNQFIYFQF